MLLNGTTEDQTMTKQGIQSLGMSRTEAGLDRREVLKVMGGLGLAATGLVAGLRPARAHQEGTPMSGPAVGPQADGTTLWKVVVGGMDMETAVELHGFFPGEITINAGDSIWFAYDMPMFHTVTFVPAGAEVPGILIPDPEVDPATAQAGPPKLIVNPIMLTGAGGTSVDGTQIVSTSGDVFMDPAAPTPWIMSFPAPGEYNYVCIPHSSVMQGKVIVQEAGSSAPMDQAAIDAAAAEQMATLYEQGKAEIEKYMTPASTDGAAGGKVWEVAAGAGGATQVRVQRFLPDTIEIAAGDTIKFINQSEGEPHTVTFVGAGETPPEDTLIEAFADGSPKFVQNMATFLPSGGNTWSGTGFLNSGFMGIPQLGLPMEFDVTFDTAGEYVVYCILHGGPDGSRMAGKVVVK